MNEKILSEWEVLALQYEYFDLIEDYETCDKIAELAESIFEMYKDN